MRSRLRAQARQGDTIKPLEEPKTSALGPQPILGDDQIEWAATYVVERLDAALAELAAAMDNLDITVGTQATQSPVTRGGAEELLLVLLDGDFELKVDRPATIKARATFPKLRTALEASSIRVRESPQT